MCEICATFGALLVVAAVVLACDGRLLSTLGGRFRELDRIEDVALRRQVRAGALSDHWTPAWARRLLVLTAITSIFVYPLHTLIVVGRLLQRRSPPIAALVVSSGLFLATTNAFVIIRAALRRGVRRPMHAAGFATCVRCGYDLRASSSNRCPEHGQTLENIETLSGDCRRPPPDSKRRTQSNATKKSTAGSSVLSRRLHRSNRRLPQTDTAVAWRGFAGE